jgi:hypothetical protein
VKRSTLVGLLLAVLAPAWAGTVQPASAAQSSCDGVWVVVDYGSLGGIETKCATSYATGAAALRSAGFGPTIEDGFVYKISGKPSKPDIKKAYWSYWQATLTSDGSYSGWSYSSLGATASHPQRGNAEGWRYQSLSDGKVPPGAAPPKGEVSPPTPKPTQSAKPSPKPTKTPTKAPPPSASATKSASTAPAPSASGKSTASASAGASETSTPPSPAPESTLTVSTPPATDPAASVAATPYASDTTGSSPDGGSPVGLIVAAAVVVLGGGGLGLWWYLRGRTR